jgi:hypothetical protein
VVSSFVDVLYMVIAPELSVDSFVATSTAGIFHRFVQRVQSSSLFDSFWILEGS